MGELAMNRRGTTDHRRQVERGLPWHRKSDCDDPAGSPAWQAWVHRHCWSGGRATRIQGDEPAFGLRRQTGNDRKSVVKNRSVLYLAGFSPGNYLG